MMRSTEIRCDAHNGETEWSDTWTMIYFSISKKHRESFDMFFFRMDHRIRLIMEASLSVKMHDSASQSTASAYTPIPSTALLTHSPPALLFF